jgi:hypothetical protein
MNCAEITNINEAAMIYLKKIPHFLWKDLGNPWKTVTVTGNRPQIKLCTYQMQALFIYLFIYLFEDVVSGSDYLAMNSMMICK